MHLVRKVISRDASLLAVAGLFAQTLNVLAYPLLTHFYTPVDFGLFSAVTAVSTFVGAIALLRIETLYQIAPREEEEGLLTSAVIVALFLTALVLVVVLLFGKVLIEKVESDLREPNWHWAYAVLLALLAFVNGVFSLAREFCAKNGRYGRLAVAQILRTSLTLGTQLGLILFLQEVGASGLMAGFALGLMAATILVWPIRIELLRSLWAGPRQALVTTGKVLHQYRVYIRVDVVNVLIRTSTLVAYPIFVLTSFGVVETGLYAVASRISFIPIDVLGAAISTVFFQRLALAVREGTGTMQLYLTTLFGGLAIALVVAGLLALVAGPLVNQFFGSEWARTGIIILYLLPTFLSRFVTMCIGNTPLALKRPDLLLQWNIAQLVILGFVSVLTRNHSLEMFLLYSGLALIMASALYAVVLFKTIARCSTFETS